MNFSIGKSSPERKFPTSTEELRIVVRNFQSVLGHYPLPLRRRVLLVARVGALRPGFQLLRPLAADDQHFDVSRNLPDGVPYPVLPNS